MTRNAVLCVLQGRGTVKHILYDLNPFHITHEISRLETSLVWM